MKILFVLPSLNLCGGIESFTMNYYRRIRGSVSCDFVTHNCMDSIYRDEIEKNGDSVFVLPPFSGSNLLRCVRDIRSFLSEHNDYDIIHCSMANAAAFYFAYTNAPIRILHSHQDRYADRLTHAIRNIPLIKLGIAMATHYAACSVAAGDFLFARSEYHIIKNALTITDFTFNPDARIRIRRELNIRDDEILLGCIGRLTEQKNHKKLFDIMLELPDKYRLVLLGDGHLEARLRQTAAELGITNRVIFAGSVSNVASYLSAMDASILPSLYEGLGIVNIESQISGLPTIVSDRIPEDANLGKLFTKIPLTEDASKWALRIRQAVAAGRLVDRTDDSLTEAAKQNGFDIESESKKLIAYYKRILKR